ncbi:anti-sigma factor [Ichthyenterobacterium sp. W332]|uniref:Anti-sigma factor n=1 Tax=Microcosmobacter mediterraneus TaxID=3075607 RepID=A0ABU2YLT9_9FLAO|nr:anti-sigma factor [Ichthyenterobacterium sp. W332]MDT0559129.1 anti-sigma factor [Ichthyenterobacterium sp. W332]
MNLKDYIESGILELYVAGALSEQENQEVYDAIQQYPELLQEVLSIETALKKLAEQAKPNSSVLYTSIKTKIGDDNAKVIPLDSKTSSWTRHLGWVAAIILGAGLFWNLNQKNALQENLRVVENENQFLEQQIELSKTDLNEAKRLLTILRDKDILSIPLGGQQVSPESYANVYWDKANNSIFLDVQGLPEPPEGKVYQVWSLTLNPLTPTSLGTINNFKEDANKIFEITNANASEAFGITLEPEGGSESPTLEQLYTLGTVAP